VNRDQNRSRRVEILAEAVELFIFSILRSEVKTEIDGTMVVNMRIPGYYFSAGISLDKRNKIKMF
jgi:hypothetical protein